MKSTSLFELLALFSCAAAFNIQDNVVGLGFTVKRTRDDEARLRYMKRGSAEYIELTLDNNVVEYWASIGIGSPAQLQQVVIDTGSSDLWVMDPSNPYCVNSNENVTTAGQIDCSQIYTFNQTESSSFVSNNTAFTISYGDTGYSGTTFANGTFAQDDLVLGDLTVNMINFAVASSTNASFPIFGVGPAYGQSTVKSINSDGTANSTYTSVIQSMVDQGFIQSVAFSLWLNDPSADSGTILFGGVDTAKYSGDLISMPIIVNPPFFDVPVQQQAAANFVQMTGISITLANQTTSIASGGFPVILDSGTALAYLPEEWLDALATGIGGLYSNDLGLYVVDCDSNAADTVSFELAGNSFPVSIGQMLFPVIDDDGHSVLDGSGNALCGLGIMSGGPYSVNSTYILGDIFLAGAYVVYDYDSSEIAVAIANLGETGSNIVPISSGIPNATPASSYSVTTFVSNFSTFTGLASDATSVNVTSDNFATDSVEYLEKPSSGTATATGGVTGTASATGGATGTSIATGGAAGTSTATGGAAGTSNATGSASASKNAAIKTGVIAGLSYYLLNMLL